MSRASLGQLGRDGAPSPSLPVIANRASSDSFDAVIIGSGFGGSMAAHVLVGSGWRVLMIERGEHVRRGPRLWDPDGAVVLSPYYSTECGYRVRGESHGTLGMFECVGGPSVFYGAASFRFRAWDFLPNEAIHGPTGARWPYGYAELEPYYSWAEEILGVAGKAGQDPTEPPRSAPYPQPPPRLSRTSKRIWDASQRLGMRPFPVPVAVNTSGRDGRPPCILCSTCDGYACAINAKNDPAGSVLPGLLRRGLVLKTGRVAVRLLRRGREIGGVECVERSTGRKEIFRARHFILSAGALGSPHLVLASGLEKLSPAPGTVGRYLTRHCNAMLFGLFAEPLCAESEFRKQVAVHDFYFGDSAADVPGGKLGSIQQVHGAPVGLVEDRLPFFLRRFAPTLSHRITGLLVIAEDQPAASNGVSLDRRRDRFGLPRLVVTHRYSRRDRAARRALLARARSIMREAGARATVAYPITTFSHALGTLRMGDDPWSSALDRGCRFRGTDNLYVMDGSCLPTSSGVNPSLTIGATSLKAASELVDLHAIGQQLPRPSLQARKIGAHP